MRFGFIGTGNMGGALARAARRKLAGEDLLLANRTEAKAAALAKELGASLSNNRTIAGNADYIFLGVKPQVMGELLKELAPVLAERTDRFVLVTMAAGLTIAGIQNMAGGDYPVLRVMPNTPCSIGEGMILYTPGPGVTAAETDSFLEAMAGAGRFALVPEGLMDAGSAVAGCGPAFVLPRAQAQAFAAQMVLGSARLILESGNHPGALKDAVCSPGGTTIQGVRKLEEAGFRGAVMDAVIAAFEKNGTLKC